MNTTVQITMTPDELRDMIRTELGQAITMAESKLLSQAEICRILHIDSRKLKDMNLPAYKVGNTLRYKISDIKPLTR